MLFPLYGRRQGVRLALGLHPLEVARVELREEISLFESYAAHTSYIGEIGLDFSSEGRQSRTTQEAVFTSLLAVDGLGDKILSVHSRSASELTIRRLVDARARRVIMHWFSGSIRDAEAALDAGFYFSINPRMAQSKRGRGIVASIPHDRVLLESDGPYARIGRRNAEPVDVLRAADYLSNAWATPLTEVLAKLSSNFRQLCSGLP
jgi:TatD DNase family protein